MKRILIVTFVLFIFGIADACTAASKISKVLPHLLDKQGRHTLSPSLLERDAYQAPVSYTHLTLPTIYTV